MRGQGAFLNNQPIHVSEKKQLEQAMLGTELGISRDAETMVRQDSARDILSAGTGNTAAGWKAAGLHVKTATPGQHCLRAEHVHAGKALPSELKPHALPCNCHSVTITPPGQQCLLAEYVNAKESFSSKASAHGTQPSVRSLCRLPRPGPLLIPAVRPGSAVHRQDRTHLPACRTPSLTASESSAPRCAQFAAQEHAP